MMNSDNSIVNEPAVMSVNELAEFLKISRQSAYKLCHNEDFPSIRINNKRIVIVREKLWKWIDAQINTPLDCEV